MWASERDRRASFRCDAFAALKKRNNGVRMEIQQKSQRACILRSPFVGLPHINQLNPQGAETNMKKERNIPFSSKC